MREIKFRAWINKIGVYAENCIINSDGGYIAYKNGVQYLNCEIEQYTGLKDSRRNNAEVFQGDIYEWCGLAFPISIDDFHGYRFMFGKDQLCKAVIENGIYKGNIHENPELLTQ